MDFDTLSSSLKSRANEKLAQVAAAKRQVRVKPDPTILSNVKLIKKQLKTKQKQMESKKKKKHMNIVQDKENTTFRQRLKERQKLRRGVLYDMADKSKKIWEILRRDETTNEVRVKLCGELMKLIEGNVKFLSMAHDTTRVIECLIQFGNEQQKQYIFDQIKSKEEKKRFLFVRCESSRGNTNDVQITLCSSCDYEVFNLWVRERMKKKNTFCIIVFSRTDAQKDAIKKSLYGHVCKLARHSVSN